MKRAMVRWDSFFGNPALMRNINGWLAVASVILIPVSMFTGWINSVTFVASLSIWALVAGHWSAYQSARVEEKQDITDQYNPNTPSVPPEILLEESEDLTP